MFVRIIIKISLLTQLEAHVLGVRAARERLPLQQRARLELRRRALRPRARPRHHPAPRPRARHYLRRLVVDTFTYTLQLQSAAILFFYLFFCTKVKKHILKDNRQGRPYCFKRFHTDNPVGQEYLDNNIRVYVLFIFFYFLQCLKKNSSTIVKHFLFKLHSLKRYSNIITI